MENEKYLPPLYDRISPLIEPYQAYLVGGAVRDLLLGHPVYDLDFSLPGESIQAARRVADQLKGAFFVLDQERETARVILRDEAGQRLMVDFTLFHGGSIEDDLRARDFTITSMALKVGGEGKVIDPFHGAQDLKDRLLQATTETSLENDPLRCLRAVRLAAQFGLKISAGTKDQIRQNREKLEGVSPERIRDELFRILAGPKQAAAIQSLEILGLWPYLHLGELAKGKIDRSRFLEDLWYLFLKDHDQHSAANWSLGLLVHRLGRFRDPLKSYLKEEPVAGRSVYQLSFLAALLMDGDLEERRRHLELVLPLSNQEKNFLVQVVPAAEHVVDLSRTGSHPQPLDIYHYFLKYGSAGVLGAFLALAEASAAYKNKADQDGWIAILEISRAFLEGWWEKNELWVDPPHLLDGDDIQREFNLQPGPRIGELLGLLREAQVGREITQRDEAYRFLENVISSSGGPEE